MAVPRPKRYGGKGNSRGSSGRVSRARSAGPIWEQPLARRRWLRIVAYILGALVLMAHVYNFPNPRLVTDLFPHSIRDVIYHSSMFMTFTLAFRLSLADVRDYGARWLRPADATALIVCCGWGALCETLQLGIPGREFHYNELALNMCVPLITVAIISLAARRG